MEEQKKYCSTFDDARSQVEKVLESYSDSQINLSAEAARKELSYKIMDTVAGINQKVFAQYIETVRFQAEMNKDTEGGTPFDEQRKVILADALWLENTGGYLALNDEEKQEHREEVLKAVAEQAGMVKVEPAGYEGETGETGEGQLNE